MSTRLSRRHLFRLRPRDFAKLLRESRESASAAGHPGERRHFRPPGAIEDETEFLRVCTRCPECSTACPYGVIFHLGPVAGTAEGSPALDPGENPCRWCPEFDCIRACPTGALRLEADGTAAPIGKARLNLETCLTEQGILCDSCATACPPRLKAIVMKNRRPELSPELCVGCGLCVFYCDSSPNSISIAPEPLEEFP